MTTPPETAAPPEAGRLAYVFLHRPAAGVDVADYAERLVEFHRALLGAAPTGLVATWAWRLPASPVGSDVYEDWYLVEDWTALGTLERAAVTAGPRPAHDGIAPLTDAGAGAVYGLVHGRPGGRPARRIRFTKPIGMPYADALARLHEAAGSGGVIWQRRLVLGPDTEFLLDSDTPGPIEPASEAIPLHPIVSPGYPTRKGSGRG